MPAITHPKTRAPIPIRFKLTFKGGKANGGSKVPSEYTKREDFYLLGGDVHKHWRLYFGLNCIPIGINQKVNNNSLHTLLRTRARVFVVAYRPCAAGKAYVLHSLDNIRGGRKLFRDTAQPNTKWNQRVVCSIQKYVWYYLPVQGFKQSRCFLKSMWGNRMWDMTDIQSQLDSNGQL